MEDFDSPSLLSQTLDFFASDQGRFVSIDVTLLMQEAQRLRLTDFQVRFLLDLAADFGFVGIEDRPTASPHSAAAHRGLHDLSACLLSILATQNKGNTLLLSGRRCINFGESPEIERAILVVNEKSAGICWRRIYEFEKES